MARDEDKDGPLANGNGEGAWDQEEVFNREDEGSLPENPDSLEARIDIERQRTLRVMADFENHKRRVLKERSTLLLYSNEKLLREILPVLDDLERTVVHSETDGHPALASFVNGVQLILARWLGILERVGAKPFNSFGEVFDPTVHEAVMQRLDKDAPPSSVVEELEKGYMLYNRLLRPAKVVVNSKRVQRFAVPSAPKPILKPEPVPEPEPIPEPEPVPEPALTPRSDSEELTGGAFEIDEEAIGSLDDWEKEFSE